MKKEPRDKSFFELSKKKQLELITMVKYQKAMGRKDNEIISLLGVTKSFFQDIIRLGNIDQYKY